MSAGSSRARPAPSRSSAMNYGLCGGFSASRSPSRPLCSLQSGERPSLRLALPAWSSARGSRASWVSKRTRTCSGTLAGSHWPTGPRYPGAASLSRTPEHSAHGALHRISAGSVQRFLEALGLARAGRAALTMRPIKDGAASLGCKCGCLTKEDRKSTRSDEARASQF